MIYVELFFMQECSERQAVQTTTWSERLQKIFEQYQ